MAGSRMWYVESKEFKVLVKEGVAGVRFYERSNGKQRSIFLQKDELAWLVKIVEELWQWKALRSFGINLELGTHG
jgi:hypothetical protein